MSTTKITVTRSSNGRYAIGETAEVPNVAAWLKQEFIEDETDELNVRIETHETTAVVTTSDRAWTVEFKIEA